MPSYTYMRTCQLPKCAVSDTELKLDCNWTNGYGGGDEAKRMDTWWEINGHWWTHSWGTSVGESANYTCQLEEIKSWAPKWKPITRVRFSFRYVYEKWTGGYYYSPILYLNKPKPAEITFEQSEKNNEPYLDITIKRDKGDYNRPVLIVDYSIQIASASGTPSTNLIGPPVPPGFVYNPAVQAAYVTDSFKDESFTKSIKLTDLGITGEGTSQIKVVANTRGLAGDTSTTATYYAGHPNVPVIKSVKANKDDVTSTVVIEYSVNADTKHPVDYVELQRLRDSDKETAYGAQHSGDWKENIRTAGAASKSMCEPLADARPTERGKRTWYRLKAVHGAHETYSLPFDMGIYDEPLDLSASGAFIASVEQADDGKSLAVEVAWRDIETVATPEELKAMVFNTEVSWGYTPYSWQSNEGAKDFLFDWECEGDDKTNRLKAINTYAKENGIEEYTHVGVCYIEGLEENSIVYLRARRKWEYDGDSGFGDYSQTVASSTNGESNFILLTAPSVIKRGEGIGLLWTITSEVRQNNWLVSGIIEPDEDDIANYIALAAEDEAEKAAAMAALDSKCVGLVSGMDASGYAVIDAETLEGANTIIAKVGVTLGNVMDESNYVLITIADAPQVQVSCDETITKTPAQITVATDSVSQVVVSVVSRGIAYNTPNGLDYQRAGDVVFAKVANIEDIELNSDGLFEGTVSLEGAQLIDNCTYDVHVYATDDITGLVSDVAICSFNVEWEHQADFASAEITVNQQERSAAIKVIAPEDFADGDVCDVYRLTTYGAELIASDVEFGSTVTDRFAPYHSRHEKGDTSYRIATRTADGDVVYQDVDYTLHCGSLRLDWGDHNYVELPFNLNLSEASEKQFKPSMRLDGTRTGSWGEGIERSGSFTTDLIRFQSQEQKRLINEVAAYPGAVFVRAGNGLAVDANVQIDSIEESYESGAIAVSLSVDVINLTQDHMCQPEDIEVPNE